jgi:putative intracellular protease/amidase
MSAEAPRRIVILAYPGVQPLDVVGPAEVFSAADGVLASERGGLGRAYEIEVVAQSTEPIATRSGGYGIARLRATAQVRGPIGLPPLPPRHIGLFRQLPAR